MKSVDDIMNISNHHHHLLQRNVCKKQNRFEIKYVDEIGLDLSQKQNNDFTTALINAFIDSDDENFYDKVASDDEYSSLNNHEHQKRMKKSKKVEIISLSRIFSSRKF